VPPSAAARDDAAGVQFRRDDTEARRTTGSAILDDRPQVGPVMALSPVRQPAGKLIHVWAIEADIDPSTIRSNSFPLEWPSRKNPFHETCTPLTRFLLIVKDS
jgi:predicted NUDIX family NTP pyrophosphohydrolase